MTFALSFVQKHWRKDYQNLKLVTDATGTPLQYDTIQADTVAKMIMEAKPNVITIWERPGATPTEEGNSPEMDFLKTLRVNRFYKVKPEGIRTLQRWDLPL